MQRKVRQKKFPSVPQGASQFSIKTTTFIFRRIQVFTAENVANNVSTRYCSLNWGKYTHLTRFVGIMFQDPRENKKFANNLPLVPTPKNRFNISWCFSSIG